jgi:hypothetical protein
MAQPKSKSDAGQTGAGAGVAARPIAMEPAAFCEPASGNAKESLDSLRSVRSWAIGTSVAGVKNGISDQTRIFRKSKRKSRSEELPCALKPPPP